MYVPEPLPLESLEDAWDLAFSSDGSLLHVIGMARIKQTLCRETGPFNPRDRACR